MLEAFNDFSKFGVPEFDRDPYEYWHELKKSPLPVYKIGIACHGKKCLVRTILHNK
jgi:hypothetical protein